MNDQQQNLERIFHAALERPASADRADYLSQACGDDPALRQQVESLLRAHEQAGNFLSPNPPPHTAGRPAGESDLAVSEKPGDRVGHYRLLEEIGQGSFSVVYRAEQEEPLRRQVALKIIKLGMDTRQVVARFEAERQVLALLDHPNIAKIFDAGATATGRPYFVMEWVRGIPISHYCEENRLPIRERLEIFIRVCQAVQHAHQKGIIHRDLKPSNILIACPDHQPVPKVIDFGIAKATREEAAHLALSTRLGQFVGTPAYMSPEQATLNGADIDTRTDIYSLGLVLYELLTGYAPFEIQDLTQTGFDELAQKIRRCDTPKPSIRLRRLAEPERRAVAARRQAALSSLQATLRGDLDAIVMKALEQDRNRRYESASALAEDLRRNLNHEPVSAAATSVGYWLRKFARRHQTTVAAAGLVVGVLLAGIVVSAWQASRASRHARFAKAHQEAAETARHQTEMALADMHVSRGLAASDRQDFPRAMLWFANTARLCQRDPERANVNRLRARTWASQSILPVRAFWAGAELRCIQFSAEGHYLLALTASNQCYVWDWPAETALLWAQAQGPVLAAAWSADGSWLALGLPSGQVQIRTVPQGVLVQSLTLQGPVTALSFSPDGRHLAVASDVVRLWNCPTRSFTDSAWPHPKPVCALLFAPSSDRLATACQDGTARVLAVPGDSNAAQPLLGPVPHQVAPAFVAKTKYREEVVGGARIIAPLFLETGRLLLTQTGSEEVTLWEVATAKPLRRIQGICDASTMGVSPRGNVFASGIEGMGAEAWDVGAADRTHQLLAHRDCVFDLAFSPDGQSLLTTSADRNAIIWGLPTGKTLHAPLPHSKAVIQATFAPQGQFLATAQSDGLIRVWRLPQANRRNRRFEYDLGPKRVRLDLAGQLVVASLEPAWDADFHRTCVYEVASGLPKGPVLECPGRLHDAALSPDGRTLATLGSPGQTETNAPAGRLEFWDVGSGKTLSTPVPLPSQPASVSWHPDGDRLAVICLGGEILLAAQTGTNRSRWLRQEGHPPGRIHPELQFTPDGTSLISLSWSGEIEVWDVATAKLRYPPIRDEGGVFWSFALSPDGRYLVTVAANGMVDVWTLQNGQKTGPSLPHPDWVFAACFSPDGQRILTAGHDGLARLWDWQAGQLVCTSLRHPDEIYDAAFTPDGRWAITACRDGTVRVLDGHRGRPVTPPFSVGQHAFNVQVTRDGQYVVCGSLSGDISALHLGGLYEPSDLNAEDLCRLGELASGYEVLEGELSALGTAEWLNRYHAFRQKHPDYFRAELSEIQEGR